MPLTVASVVIMPILLGVYHDKVPPIIHANTNAAGAAINHTHLGSPSKLLFSLIKMSISSFIVVSFKLLMTPLCVLTGWGPSLHSGRISVF